MKLARLVEFADAYIKPKCRMVEFVGMAEFRIMGNHTKATLARFLYFVIKPIAYLF